MLGLLSNNVMENVRKEHMTTFHERLPICDHTLGLKFFKQVQVHYNMMIEKL